MRISQASHKVALPSKRWLHEKRGRYCTLYVSNCRITSQSSARSLHVGTCQYFNIFDFLRTIDYPPTLYCIVVFPQVRFCSRSIYALRNPSSQIRLYSIMHRRHSGPLGFLLAYTFSLHPSSGQVSSSYQVAAGSIASTYLPLVIAPILSSCHPHHSLHAGSSSASHAPSRRFPCPWINDPAAVRPPSPKNWPSSCPPASLSRASFGAYSIAASMSIPGLLRRGHASPSGPKISIPDLSICCETKLSGNIRAIVEKVI